MEIEKCFEELEKKYGEDFCWFRIDPEQNGFVAEAYREITEGHSLYGMKLTCLAKCEANDDVLYITEHEQFVVIHLTYSENNAVGYPKYKLLDTHQELKEYLEQSYISV